MVSGCSPDASGKLWGPWCFMEKTTDGNPAPVPHPPNVNVMGLCICQAQIETKESDLTQKLECFATGENPYYVTLVGNPTSPGIFQF